MLQIIRRDAFGRTIGAAIDAKADIESLRKLRQQLLDLEKQEEADVLFINVPSLFPNTSDGPAIQLSPADVFEIEAATDAVANSINLPPNHPLRITFVTGLTTADVGFAIEDLIELWTQRVREERPIIKKKLSGAAIAGGLFIGIVAIGAIAYAKYREDTGR